MKARRNDRVSATEADGTRERQGDSGVGYPVGRDDLNGTLARVTYRAPGPPPDLQCPPDDLYEGRPQVRSTWRKHLDAKRAAERPVGKIDGLGARGQSMDIRNGFVEAVGSTPLIRLADLSEATGCEILGKAEFMNPGGSVKDRAAWWIIREHERSGALEPGGTVVEGTAGNTGIGIAHICNARGYRCVIYMPDNQSPEKVEILRTLGAEVRVVPTVPYANDANYQKQAGRHAAAVKGAVWANQFDNTANRLAHIESTGPEIWRQTDGKVDAFVSAVGTGGTLSGVSAYLKERRADIQLVLADCMGSALFNYVETGDAKMSQGPSITEGIGNSRVTDNLAGADIDWAEQIADQDMVDMVYSQLRNAGWFLGSSTGINLCAAVRVAKRLGPNHVIVTMLCDDGAKYRSRLFNRDWLAERGLTVPGSVG